MENGRISFRCWARAMLLAVALAALVWPTPLAAEEWVIKTAELELEVLNTEAALADLIAIATELGGRVVSGTKWRDGASIDATVTLGVPPAAFEEALGRFRARAAAVGHQQVGTEDVSARLADLDATIRALEQEAARLRSSVEQARSTPEAVAAQRELDKVNGRLAEVTTQRTSLVTRASEARITLEIRERRPTLTPTSTITPIPPTPTSTATPVPPTSTSTATPVPPTSTSTATPIPPTPTPTLWDPGRVFQKAQGVQQRFLQTVTDASIWFGMVCLPLLGLGVLVWLAWRRARRSKK